MKKGEIFFQIEISYQTKLFKPLSELGTREYNKKSKKYIWKFPIKDIQKVLAITGKPIEFSDTDAQSVVNYSKLSNKEIKLDKKYGDGFINVSVHPTKPDYFTVTTVRNKKPQNTHVSFETVSKLWSVVKKQPKDKKILTGTVACNYCSALGIIDFNTYKGSNFNWKYFSGSRKHYLVFYAAIKVLAHYNAIEHIVKASKSGIIRKVDSWEVQTELNS